MDGAAVRGYENAAGATTTSIFRRKAGLVQNIFGPSYNGENIAAADLEPVLPTIGARRSAVPGGPNPVDASFGGLLHELLVFPTALAEQKLRDVQNYLQSKWAGAVIWNLSTELKPIALSAGPDAQRRIIRGGFGKDQLSGGPGDDIISGGAGDDALTGGGGPTASSSAVWTPAARRSSTSTPRKISSTSRPCSGERRAMRGNPFPCASIRITPRRFRRSTACSSSGFLAEARRKSC
jgi:hypothetical protein